MNKKLNTFVRYLETVHPLQAEVHLNPLYDIKIYETPHSAEEKNYLTVGVLLGDPESRKRFYDKCIEYIVNLGLRRIQEYLFYCTNYQQGMIMTYRPDTRRKGLWCFSVISILPFKRHVMLPHHPTRKALLERLIKLSQMPSEALQYVLELADRNNGLLRAYESVVSGQWDTAVFTGDHDLEVTLEKSKVKSVSSKATHRTLKLVEV